MATDHIVRSFDDDLSRLSDLVSRMGGIAENQLDKAINALQTRDSALAEEVIETDPRIDALQYEIEELALRMIALRQPMAGDLRETVAAIKIAPLIERVGDYAKNVAKRAIALNQIPPVKPLFTVPRMGRMVREMLKDVLDAFANQDIDKARKVWLADEEVDEMHDSLFREMLTYMMEDPRNITPCTHLLFVARNIERMGDLATNVAEVIHFQVTGDILGGERPKVDDASITIIEAK